MATILIVDDDDHQRLLYREELERKGHTVLEARSGKEAVGAVMREPPDAVVLDINMPGMDGVETLARLHNLNHRLPIVLNSAYATYRNQFVTWIADAYVVKSSNLEELSRTVQSVLAQRGSPSPPTRIAL